MVTFRIAGDGDVDAITALVNADRIFGQPECRADDVRRAMIGASDMERAWWDAFVDLTTVVAIDGASVVGAASWAVHSGEGIAYVLWLHAREQPQVVQALLDDLAHRLAPHPPLRAFWIATPLSLGMEALPIQRRPVTHAALVGLGFAAHDEWLYMAGRPVSEASDVATVQVTGPSKWKLTIGDESDAAIGSAIVELGRDGVGVVWWLEVKPAHRRRSHGRALLLQAMKLLGAAGADRIILYVDHDDPVGRDRRHAIHLYEQLGFRTVDHL